MDQDNRRVIQQEAEAPNSKVVFNLEARATTAFFEVSYIPPRGRSIPDSHSLNVIHGDLKGVRGAPPSNLHQADDEICLDQCDHIEDWNSQGSAIMAFVPSSRTRPSQSL